MEKYKILNFKKGKKFKISFRAAKTQKEYNLFMISYKYNKN